MGSKRLREHAVRTRDHHTCQRCGRTQKADKHSLKIHYIDHNRMNHDPTNLMAVCHDCYDWLMIAQLS